jgi:alpha-glucuronidase
MQGIGFDRTDSGSGAISQYQPALAEIYESRDTVPNDFLLFFHRVGWDEMLDTGRTVWEELVYRYSLGVHGVDTMVNTWQMVAPDRIDAQRYAEMNDFLEIQHYEARWWRDACLSYFGSQGGKTISSDYAPSENDLGTYKQIAGQCPPNRDKPRCQPVYTGEPSPAILNQ